MNGTGEAGQPQLAPLPAQGDARARASVLKPPDDAFSFSQPQIADLRAVARNDAQLPSPNGRDSGAFLSLAKPAGDVGTASSVAFGLAHDSSKELYVTCSESRSECFPPPVKDDSAEPGASGMYGSDGGDDLFHDLGGGMVDSSFGVVGHHLSTAPVDASGVSVACASGQSFEFESMLSPNVSSQFGETGNAGDMGQFELSLLDDVEFPINDEVTTVYKVRDQRRRHPTAPCSLLAASRPSSSLTQDFLNVFSLPPPPVARVRRKSRGKPDSIFSLLKKNGMTDGTTWSRARSCSLRHVDQSTFQSNHGGLMSSPLGKSKSDEAVQKSGLSNRRNSVRSRSKPLPLIIPPYVFFNRFQSQLRSPSLSENHAVSMFGVHARTPYTPPPILSPLRRGSGLFCRIRRPSPVAPKSAPVCCSRQDFWSNVDLNNALVTATSQSDDVSAAIQSPPDSPVKTDSLPHINVGTEYQAVIPPCLGPLAESKEDSDDMATVLFDPACLKHVTEESMEAYMLLASSPAVHVGGTNTEMAMHLLYDCNGDVALAASRLVGTNPLFPVGHKLFDYAYNDCSEWTPDEVVTFEEALFKSDKDFNEISAAVGTKTVAECVSFYYTWKMVFKRSYQAYRIAKQRKEYLQFSGVRCSAQLLEQQQKVVPRQPLSPGAAVSSTSSPAAAAGANRGDRFHVFPCNICGKVFYKVKSRNAHMKIHYKI